MSQTVEVRRGVMGQTVVMKMLLLQFSKADCFGKAIVVTGFMENKCLKQPNMFICKCTDISR